MGDNLTTSSETGSWLYHPMFPADWTRQPLYSLAEWVNGLAFGNIQFSKTGMPVIKIAEIKSGISGQTRFTEQAFDDSVHVRHGDLLFSWSGQPETSIDVFWWKGPEGWLNQHTFRVTPANNIDSRFFYYLLRYLKANFIGIARNKQTTGLGHVTKLDLESIEAAHPDIPEQRAIAHILGALDDKIELNRRMNATLEAMAQALFKSWFVNFDPFRDQGMQDSPMGEIPVAWQVGRVDDMAVLHRQSIKPTDYPDETFDHYSIPAYDEGRAPRAEPGVQIRSSKTQIPDQAILISKLNPRFPRVWLPLHTMQQRAVCSTEFLVVTPKADLSREYIYPLFSSRAFLETFSTLVTGTSSSHQRVRPEDLLTIDAAIPPVEVIRSFSGIVSPLFTLRKNNLDQNSTLAAIRDVLLPRLLSGEIRVKDAEKSVEVKI